METLTLFIDHLYSDELGSEEFQLISNRSFKSKEFNDLTISGARFLEVVFEDTLFTNCVFFGSTLDNCLFINCMFINCKFQFSSFSNCNFESSSFDNCMWGFTALVDSELLSSETLNNISLESGIISEKTRTVTLSEFINLSA